MRKTWLCTGALALAVVGVTLVLPGTWLDWPWGARAAPAAQGPQQAQAAPMLRHLAPVDVVERVSLQQVLARLPPGTVVLDLEALESLDAALDLVQHWRSQNRADAVLTCWLATAGRGPELAEAVQALTEQGCSTLRLALSARPQAAHAAIGG